MIVTAASGVVRAGVAVKTMARHLTVASFVSPQHITAEVAERMATFAPTGVVVPPPPIAVAAATVTTPLPVFPLSVSK